MGEWLILSGKTQIEKMENPMGWVQNWWLAIHG